MAGSDQSSADEEFAAFVGAALPSLLRFGHMIAGSSEAGEDLVQSALASTLAAWGRVRRREDPFAYVRRSMININCSAWRRWGARVQYGALPDREGGDVAQDVSNGVSIRSALAGLPPRQRTVLVLRYYCDLSEVEIANVMGVRAGTVKSQAARALERLRRDLGAMSGSGSDSEVSRGC